MKYPIGIQNFCEVRRNGYVYVDKAKPFADDSRILYKIGINYSSDQKLIDDWKVV